MKKILVFLLVLSIFSSLVGCKKEEKLTPDSSVAESTEDVATEATSEETTEKVATSTTEETKEFEELSYANLSFEIPAPYSSMEEESFIAFYKNEVKSLPGIMINAGEAGDLGNLEEDDVLELMILSQDIDTDTIETFENINGLLITKATKQVKSEGNTTMNDVHVFATNDEEYLYFIHYIADGKTSNEDETVIDNFIESLKVIQ